MNTKSSKYLILTAAVLATIGLASYIILSNVSQRNIATANSAAQNLTEKQKEKWAMIETFQIRQTNESLQIDIPHLVDLCTNNTFINFQLSAYDVSIAGANPKLILKISCQQALEKMQTQFEVRYLDLLSLHETKQNKLDFGHLTSELIYTDDSFPNKWNLNQISIEGANSFQINQFEIQKVFGNNFEFELN